MKKLLLLILFVLNLVLLQAQEVKFISVNEADTTLENINYKSLQKRLQKDSLTADTLATPAKWMLKLNKKLSKQQRADSNIYIFFCHNIQDSVTAFLPLSGKYGYVLFDTAKTGVVELEKLQLRLSTHKYQWDLIHDPEDILFAWGVDEEESQAFRQEGTDMQIICDPFLLNKINESKIFYTPDLQKIDLGRLDNAKANKFYTLQDTTESAQGTVNGFIKDSKQYVMIYGANSLEVKRFKHAEGDEVPIEDILYSGTDEPQKINIDCENQNIWIDNSTDKYGFECTECEYSDVSCSELLVKYKDSPLFQSEIFRQAILEDPCLLENGGITIHFPDNLLEQEESDLSKIAAIAIGGTLLSTIGVATILEAVVMPTVEGAIVVANSSGTALVVNAIASETGMLLEFISSSYKLFLAGAVISASTQYFGNYAMYEDWQVAYERIDLLDATADGMLFSLTMGTGSALSLLSNGPKIMFYKSGIQTAQIFTVEFTKATFDFQLESQELQSIFDGNKESYEAFCTFLFSMITSFTVDEIQGIFVKWSTMDITNDAIYKTFSSERKAIADKIDVIVKSEGFKNSINVPTSALYQFISDFASKEMEISFTKVETKEVEVSLEDYIQEQYSTPMDNTQINLLIVKP